MRWSLLGVIVLQVTHVLHHLLQLLPLRQLREVLGIALLCYLSKVILNLSLSAGSARQFDAGAIYGEHPSYLGSCFVSRVLQHLIPLTRSLCQPMLTPFFYGRTRGARFACSSFGRSLFLMAMMT